MTANMRIARTTVVVVFVICAASCTTVRAQHAQHAHPAPPDTARTLEHAQHAHAASEPGVLPSMVRQPSGTAWQPDETPHMGTHHMRGAWMLSTHYLLFGGYDVQGNPRGGDEGIGVGWAMAMAERRTPSTSLGFRLMLSPEPYTVGKSGYPLLLQSGETNDGLPLHDRQHPHDLFMEVGSLFTAEVRPGWGVQLYGALAGEPAIGPVAFPHRFSATADPMAALGHHWIDATHISFGVVTAGLLTPMAKIEASWFNGREPDENRTDFDLRRLDSYSLRLAVNPTARTSAQVSFADLDSPEALEPGESQHRLTASGTYHCGSGERWWATTLAFGRNVAHDDATDAVLAESTLWWNALHILFGRAEYVEKTGADLQLPNSPPADVHGIGSLSLGCVRNLTRGTRIQPGIGVRLTLNIVGSELRDTYGTRTPVGGIVYLRLAPGLPGG